MAKAKPDSEIKIALAALRLAVRQSWSRLTLDQIARAAKLSPAQVKKLFPEKDDILPAIIRYVDQETAEACGKADRNAAPHDRLFEVMMARLDVLQKHRRAILGIMEEARRNTGIIRRLLPAEAEAMRKMLKLAGLEQKGVQEPVAVVGLLGVYALALCCWRGDPSADMSKTMAALDRYLRRAGALAEILLRALP